MSSGPFPFPERGERSGPFPLPERGEPPDGTPAPYGVNQVGHGGPVNSDFSQLHPLARLPESLRSRDSVELPATGVGHRAYGPGSPPSTA